MSLHLPHAVPDQLGNNCQLIVGPLPSALSALKRGRVSPGQAAPSVNGRVV